MFNGTPRNIASYSLLLHMVAKITDLKVGEFVHTLGDAHIYLDAVDAAKEQIARAPFPQPSLFIEDRNQSTIDDFEMADFELKDYECHPAIKVKMAV